MGLGFLAVCGHARGEVGSGDERQAVAQHDTHGELKRRILDALTTMGRLLPRDASRVARESLPALGLHIVMGPGAALKIANLVDTMERAVVAPTEMVCLAE
jgi:hypothetical protein